MLFIWRNKATEGTTFTHVWINIWIKSSILFHLIILKSEIVWLINITLLKDKARKTKTPKKRLWFSWGQDIKNFLNFFLIQKVISNFPMQNVYPIMRDVYGFPRYHGISLLLEKIYFSFPIYVFIHFLPYFTKFQVAYSKNTYNKVTDKSET